MTRPSPVLLVFALLAAAAAAIFLAISVDRGVYAPGAYRVRNELAQHTNVDRDERNLSPAERRWLSPTRILRKGYSIVAFSILGFFVAPLVRRRYRLRADVAAVAAFSSVIEVVQKVFGSHEGYASNAFDIACGAVGGLIGGAVWNALTRRRLRDGAAP